MHFHLHFPSTCSQGWDISSCRKHSFSPWWNLMVSLLHLIAWINLMYTGIHHVYVSSVSASSLWTHQLNLMYSDVSGKTAWESKKQRRTCWTSWLNKSQWEFQTDWDPALGLYSPVIFNRPPLAYYTAFPPETFRKHVQLLFLLTCSQIQTESKNDSIEALQPPLPPRYISLSLLLEKKQGEKCLVKSWHAPKEWHRLGSCPTLVSEPSTIC